MATRYLHIKARKRRNIVENLINDGLYTGFGPNSLAFVPADSEHISPVDRALISIFRRLNGDDIRVKKDNLSSNTHNDFHQNHPAKKLRREYASSPEDGLRLLLDLMRDTASSTNHETHINRFQNDGGSSRTRIIRLRRDANRSAVGYSGSSLPGSRSRSGRRIDDEFQRDDLIINDEFTTQIAERFILFGGLSSVLSILLHGTNRQPKFSPTTNGKPKDLFVKNVRTKNLCLEVLFMLCVLAPESVKTLNEHDELFAFSFHCLASEALRKNSCKLIEVLLMERQDTFNLCSVPTLRGILQVLEGNKLGSLCRILSITMSDLDTLEHNKNLLAQIKQKRSCNEVVQTREINHELIMSVPSLVKKIIDLAVNTVYGPRYPNSPTEIDNWMRFIDDNISNDIGNELGDAFASTSQYQRSTAVGTMQTYIDHDMQSESQPENDLNSVYHGSFDNAAMSIADHLLIRIEALYVLSLLLIGKHRKKVQKEFAELSLIPKLSNLMDNFVWKSNTGRSRIWNLAGHFQDCECSPEVAIKIQFLRLLHSFCDQNPYKHLLLTACESEELRRIKPTYIQSNTFQYNSEGISRPSESDATIGNLMTSSPEAQIHPTQTVVKLAGASSAHAMTAEQSTQCNNVNLMCQGTHGLLSKVIEVLKKEPTQSTFRFWLCRAVESFLRGGIAYADQIFLLRRGLLQHVTSTIINTEHRTIQNDIKPIIQSSFDLLGEMIKFNFDACQQLDAILNTEAKLKKTMILINDNLIDSNMFIRYVYYLSF